MKVDWLYVYKIIFENWRSVKRRSFEIFTKSEILKLKID